MKIIALIIVSIFLIGLMPVQAQQQEDKWIELNRKAVELYKAGQYDEAVSIMKELLELVEKDLGPDHPNVASSLNNLAAFYDAQGQYDQAEPLYKRALTIKEKALGSNHPDVAVGLNNLAKLYRNTGRTKEAEELKKQAKKIWNSQQ